MKYPLHVVERPGNTLEPYAIADADNIIVCTVMQSGWSWSFANWIVRSANRWHRWRKFFRPYTSDDWWEEPNRPNQSRRSARMLSPKGSELPDRL